MRVRDGRVQKKNSWRPDLGDYRVCRQSEIQLDRRPAGKGFRHLVTIAQLRDFIEVLPDWQEVAIGLDAIVLDEGQDCMGRQGDGVVAVCAWEQTLWWDDGVRGFEEDHRDVLDLLGVERESVEAGVTRHAGRITPRPMRSRCSAWCGRRTRSGSKSESRSRVVRREQVQLPLHGQRE
jgi:hypothetical protein